MIFRVGSARINWVIIVIMVSLVRIIPALTYLDLDEMRVWLIIRSPDSRQADVTQPWPGPSQTYWITRVNYTLLVTRLKISNNLSGRKLDLSSSTRQWNIAVWRIKIMGMKSFLSDFAVMLLPYQMISSHSFSRPGTSGIFKNDP